MKKLIMTKGLPASGKTTWAHKMLEENPGAYKIVCKDDLRAMLDNGKWTGVNEKFILEIQDMIILKALEDGKHVIICDTNLNPLHEDRMRNLIKDMKGKVELQIQDFTDVTVEECIKRDLKRSHPVGERVIRQQYKQWLEKREDSPNHDPKLPDTVIIDVDGTLALHNGRSPFEFDRIHLDLINEPVRDIVNSLPKEWRRIIVTGREEKYRDETAKWLTLNHVSYSFLYMRKTDDKRKDAIIKEEIYRSDILGKYNVKLVIDDRNQTVEKWRQLGLTCIQVAEGEF